MRVTVRSVKRNGVRRWEVDYQPTGAPRVRRFFRTRDSADAEAELIRRRQNEAGSVWVSLPAPVRAELVDVAREIMDAGLGLREVWEAYKRTEQPTERQTAGKALDATIAAKRTANRRREYLENLRTIVAQFIRGRELVDVREFTTAHVDAFLRPELAPATRASMLSRLSSWFEFCRSRGWIARNPCDRVTKITLEQGVPEVLTVRLSARVMVAARRHCPVALAWFALSMFAGLRPSEAERIGWDAVDWERRTVTVDAAASKVRRRRIVPLEPAAVAWLKLAHRMGARLPIDHTARRRALRTVRERLRMKEWPQDVLRHTAASYLVALRKDVARVALDLGNSPGVLLRNYRDLVRDEDCARFWRLLPRR